VRGCAAADFNGRYCERDFLLLTRNADGYIGGRPLGYRGYEAFLFNRGVAHTINEIEKQAKADLPPGTLLTMGGPMQGQGYAAALAAAQAQRRTVAGVQPGRMSLPLPRRSVIG